MLLGVLRRAKESMSAEVYKAYFKAIILLVSVWGWYPIAYAIHNWTSGSDATTAIQVGFSFADIAAKAGFGAMIHKIAKLRTAEDVNAGEVSHPEDVWISSVKYSDGVQPALKGLPTARLESLLQRVEPSERAYGLRRQLPADRHLLRPLRSAGRAPRPAHDQGPHREPMAGGDGGVGPGRAGLPLVRGDRR